MSPDGVETDRPLRAKLTAGEFPDSRPIGLLPVLGIVLSETALFLGQIDYALWGHFLTLMFALVAPLRLEEQQNVLQALAVVPLFRLVNLGMPVFFELTLLWYPLIYAPLVPAAYLLLTAREDLQVDWGWRMAAIAAPIALPLSAAMGYLEYRIIEPAALIPAWTPANILLLGFVMVAFVGFVEELLFRGILQRSLQLDIERWTGLALASILFGLMHSGYQDPVEILFATGIGLLYGLVYDYTDSLVLITLMHGVLNVFLFGVAPIHGIPFGL